METLRTDASPLFLFVNKNAENLRHRDPEEAFAISSYVSGTYMKRAKAARREGSHSDAVAIRVRAKAGEYDKKTKGQRSWRVGPAPRSRVPPASQNLLLVGPVAPCTPLSGSTGLKQWESIQSTVLYPSPQSIIAHGNTDPFNCTSVPLRPSDHDLVRFWQGFFLSSICSADGSIASRGPAMAAWYDDMKSAIADDSRLHALIACGLSFKSGLLPDVTSRSETAAEALKHKNTSMKTLRRRLANGVPESTAIPAVYQLCATEFYSRNPLACEVHLAVIKRLVDGIGGLGLLFWTRKRELVVIDLIVALHMLRRPHFVVEDWDLGPWNRQPLSQKYPAPEMIDMTALHQEVPTDVIHYFEMQRELLAVKQLATTTKVNESVSTKIYDWVHVRRFALCATMMHRYFDFQESLLPVHIKADAIEATLKACSFMAVCFCSTFIREPSKFYIDSYVPFRHLRTSMQRLIQLAANEGHLKNPNLMLWLFFVGSLEEELHSARHTTPETRWFSRGLLELAGRLSLRSWEQVRAVLCQFVYKRDPLDDFLKSLLAKSNSLLAGHTPTLPVFASARS
jgi:hypothetical protein